AVLSSTYLLLYCSELLLIGPRGQNVASVFSEPGENSCYVRGCLALSENDLRHAGAEGTMVIHFGEAEVFEGQVAQAVNRVVGRKFSAADLVEKFADGFSVHRCTQHAALSTQHSAFSNRPE